MARLNTDAVNIIRVAVDMDTVFMQITQSDGELRSFCTLCYSFTSFALISRQEKRVPNFGGKLE